MTPMYQDQLVAYQNQKLWFLLLGCGALLMGALGVIASFALRPGPTPYVVAVESNTGRFLAVSRPIAGTDALMPSIIKWVVSEYVQNAFRIERNRDDEITNLKHVYELSSPDSGKLLTAYYQDDKGKNDPIIQGPKVHQQVSIVDVLPLHTKDMYQVDFTTTRVSYDQQDVTTTTNWRATMQVVIGQPTKTNPLGIYISSLDFAPQATMADAQ